MSTRLKTRDSDEQVQPYEPVDAFPVLRLYCLVASVAFFGSGVLFFFLWVISVYFTTLAEVIETTTLGSLFGSAATSLVSSLEAPGQSLGNTKADCFLNPASGDGCWQNPNTPGLVRPQRVG